MALITLTDDNFDSEVTNGKGLFLVDFWAVWCGPCQILGPIIEELAGEVEKDVKVGKISVDENRETASKFQVMSIPTVILFKDGKPREIWVGVRDKSEYISGINKHK